MTTATRLPLVPVAAMAAAALATASWAGLSRMGFRLGDAPADLHGPLMILGFLGTVISAERAVGLDRTWAWAAPLLAGAGAVTLLVGDRGIGFVLLFAAGLALTVVYAKALQIGRLPLHLVVEALGTVAWLVAVGALLFGVSIPETVPSQAGFLVLTILGERLELSRMAPSRNPWRRRVLGVTALLLPFTSAWAAFIDFRAGARLFGVALVLLVALSVAGDIARRTVRTPGVTGYMAAAILAGYVWLAAAGVMWAGGALVPGTTSYDPALHTLFVGFVLSMVFGHAPVIVPAVARINLPFHGSWWTALAALHLSLGLRLVGSLMGSLTLRSWGGAANVAALALFLLVAVASAWRGRSAT